MILGAGHGPCVARFPDPEPTAYRDGWLPGG